MQKHVIVLLVIIFSLVMVNCSSENENNKEEKPDIAVNEFDSTDLPTTGIETGEGNDNFSLTYNFKIGESFNCRLTTLSNSKRTVETDSVVSNLLNQKIIRLLNFNTISVKSDSIAELKCIVTNIYVEANVDGEKIIYQSGSKLDSAEAARFIEHEGLVNNPFHFRITKYGEVLDVFNVDKLMNKYLELSGMMDPQKIQEQATFKDNIMKNLLKPLLGQVFREFPSQQVEVESTWDKQIEPSPVLVFKVQFTNHYNVEGLGLFNNDRIAIINGTSTSSVEGENKHSRNGIYYIFQTPVSKAYGKIFFNINKGMIQKSKTNTLLELSYSMQMPTPEGVKKGKSSEVVSNNNILELL